MALGVAITMGEFGTINLSFNLSRPNLSVGLAFE
jgi:hypothetical protein